MPELNKLTMAGRKQTFSAECGNKNSEDPGQTGNQTWRGKDERKCGNIIIQTMVCDLL